MKIAVCLSGETRNFNRVLEMDRRGPLNFINELKKFYPDVDIFGHTWKHCEKPNESIVKFEKLLIQDQSMIDDWVKEDFLNRAYSNRDGWNKQNRLSEMSPEEFVKIHLERSRAAYGQVFSAFKCFREVPLDRYDVIIRYRWDLEHKGDTDYFENTIIDRIGWLLRRTDQGITAGMGSSNTTLYTANPPMMTMEDTFFMLNTAGHSYVKSVPIEHRLDVIFESNWGNEKSEAHTLWTSALFTPVPSRNPKDPRDQEITFALHLPNMFQLIRLPGEKINPFAHLDD